MFLKFSALSIIDWIAENKTGIVALSMSSSLKRFQTALSLNSRPGGHPSLVASATLDHRSFYLVGVKASYALQKAYKSMICKDNIDHK